MKCPKCHYLSFDPEPRCRNCGYTLELGDADLAIKPADEPVEGALADLTLRAPVTSTLHAAPESSLSLVADDEPAAADVTDAPVAQSRRRRRSPAARGPFDAKDLALEAARDLDAVSLVEESSILSPEAAEPALPMPSKPPRVDERPAAAARPRPPVAPVTTELPLFVKTMATPDVDDVDAPTHDRDALAAALMKVDATPPVATPRIDMPLRPRASAEVTPRKLGPLDHDLLEDLARLEDAERREARGDAGDRVGAVSRLGAAVIDGVLLSALSAAVVWTTLRWCGLPLADVQVLPIAPTLAFLLVVGLGYLLLFTAAGGQTIGKMLCRIRVVDEADDVLPLRQAIYREVVALPSVLALGLGFFPALVGEERALHDRLAHTKVVRA
ncbi:MAG: RDD family protein [Acidobacteriota bacterium]